MNDLDWLARNVHEWKYGCSLVMHGVNGFANWSTKTSDGNHPGWYTKAEWLARRAELQNKPSWVLAPELANWLGQDEDGVWYWHDSEPKCSTPNRNGFWMSNRDSTIAQGGEVLGDWRDTLEKRPETNQMQGRINRVKPVLLIPECGITPEKSLEACSASIGMLNADDNQELSELEMLEKVGHSISGKRHRITTSKYTKTINGVPVDVYDVLKAWNVINPALQHLIKKALQCGQRGHKDNAQDLQDIIDSAIRAKELES